MELRTALPNRTDYFRDYLLGFCQGAEPVICSKDVYFKIENALWPL